MPVFLRNPNFPDDLDIAPSVNSISHLHTLTDGWDETAQRDAIQRYGIAGRVWEAAYALIQYVEPPSNAIFDPPFLPPFTSRKSVAILELGSGMGLVVSCIANVLNSSEDILIATELPEVFQSLVGVFRLTSKDTLHVRPLAWGNDLHGLDIYSDILSCFDLPRTLTHIVCSDLVYFFELLAPLLRTLIQLTAPPFSQLPTEDDSGVTVIISYKVRSLSKESPFWSAFGLWFHFEPILMNDVHTESGWLPCGTTDDIPFIFIARRRPESFSWTIPAGDNELLSGKGAWGNNTAKTDDTFENILFMRMEVSDIF